MQHYKNIGSSSSCNCFRMRPNLTRARVEQQFSHFNGAREKKKLISYFNTDCGRLLCSVALILLEKLFRFFVSLCAAQADETVILFADVSHSMKRTEWLNLKSFLYVLNFVFISTHFSDSATKKFSCILMRRAVGVAESCTRSHVRFTIELYTARCATINPTTNNDELMVNDSYIYFCFLLRSCFCFVLCV